MHFRTKIGLAFMRTWMGAANTSSPKTNPQDHDKTWSKQMENFRYTDSMIHHRAIILIGVFIIALTTLPRASHADESGKGPIVSPDGMVEVEPSFIVETRMEGHYELVPYGERRGKWGSQFGLGYAQFTPTNYPSEFLADTFEFIYGDAEMGMLELLYTFKRNLNIGSIGLELGVGIYQNSSDTDLIDGELELIPIRLGLTVILDQLFTIPYVAPYASAGAYTIMYKETIEGGDNEFGGNTQVAPYVSLGAQFSLDWMDPQASREGYEQSGIQGTFVYLEARKYFAAGGSSDPDFETEFEPSAGLRVEF